MSGLDLPVGWLSVPLRDVVVDVKTSDPALKPNTNITYFDISSIDREAGMVTDAKVVLGAEAPSRARQVVQVGDVLFSTVRPNLRAIAQVPSVSNGMASTGFCVLRAAENVESKYLHAYVRSEEFLDALLPLQRGSSYPAVRSGDVLSQPIPLAPAAEQTRIVEKLEELLSDLDAGVAELKAAQKKLGQYRQSLLKAAVEGALTADWRKNQKSQKTKPSESGAQLLKRILHERRTRWEAKQLAKFKEQGKTPAKGWQSKYVEQVAPETAGLPDLPEEWVWASLDSLIDEGPQNGLYLPATLYGRGCPMLRIDDFQIGWARSREKLNLVDAGADTVATYALRAGDIVINRVNSMTHLGKSLVVSESLSGVLFESNMMRSRLLQLINSDYVGLYLGSELGRKRLTSTAKWAVNQASINQQDVKKTPVPISSFAEQCEIAVVVGHLLMAAEVQAKAITHSLKQASAQRKNILKAAFSGQLVPQDPQDEPASALLARIRQQRAERDKEPKASKTRSKTNKKLKA